MSTTAEQVITPDAISDGTDYNEYRLMIDELLEQGKTTGTNHSDAMVHYTKMNVQRMRRLDKQIQFSDDLVDQLNQVDEKWIWLVLTEAWCGDAAQNIPAIAKMAGQSEYIDLKLILRDQHLDIMDEYLTDGGRSIPKLICLNAETLEEIGTWGPRPAEAQKKALKWKDDPDISKKEWVEMLHKWYAQDKTQTQQTEFKQLIEEWQ